MKKKLNLNNLKVKSFVTSLDDNLVNTVVGGISGAAYTCVPREEISSKCAFETENGCYTDYKCVYPDTISDC